MIGHKHCSICGKALLYNEAIAIGAGKFVCISCFYSEGKKDG